MFFHFHKMVSEFVRNIHLRKIHRNQLMEKIKTLIGK